MMDLVSAFADLMDAGPVTRRHPWRDSIERQARELQGSPLPVLRGLWDAYDGTNSPEGWEGEAIHLALNLAGDGAYCAV